MTRGEISRCFVRNTQDEGIRVVGTDILVTRCTAVVTGDDGFDSEESDFSARIRFEKCKSIGSADEAFRTDVAGTEFVKCFSSGADEEGFDVQASDCLVDRCKVKGCRRAFELQNATGGLVTRCKAKGPSQNGVLLDESTGVRVERVTITKAGENGVEVRVGSTGNTLSRVKAKKSAEADLRDENGEGANTYERTKFRVEDFSPFEF